MEKKKSRGMRALRKLKENNNEIRKLMDENKRLERSLTNCFTELDIQHKKRTKK